ncbi:hypothetical protein RYJ27_03860 [Microbacterium limosum]|uniref:Uncharacterized protein n=1 Tax=Microbacterium limosum TaxID=3079935 RepID=A0AAU0MI82_9MICO|nr:hypothetical protein [Microbacterium sp. Y20]WOQ70356.1 hypothetical protein RYJ27_03860 [Microbacterium sp. Y20]
MGPRSLPLWLPAGMPGFMTRSNAAYRAAGERRAGLTRAKKRELLAALGA